MTAVEILHLRQPLLPLTACALTIGNFDGVHRGHQALVHALVGLARSRGLASCVLTFEPHPREYFAAETGRAAPPRIATLRDKTVALAGLGVDRLCIAPFDRSLASLSAERFADEIVYGALNARRVLIGDDFRFGARRGGDLALLVRHGQRFNATAETLATVREDGERVSSSLVREALAQADFPRVERLIGRPYALSGHVIHGRKLGRQLGFPTMNLRLGRGTPALAGVFAVEISGVDAGTGRPLPAVASLGTRPAVESAGRPLLEVFVPGWQGDAYGKLVSVRFRRKLRDERNFPDLDSLREQIARDVADAEGSWSAGPDSAGAGPDRRRLIDPVGSVSTVDPVGTLGSVSTVDAVGTGAPEGPVPAPDRSPGQRTDRRAV